MPRKNREDNIAYGKLYREANREKLRADSRAYYAANKEKELERSKAKAFKYRDQQKKWKRKNRARLAAQEAKRRAAKLNATPKWLSLEHLTKIDQFYKDAQYLTYYTKIPFEVDHVIPLQGKNANGLHVPWNLQLITMNENCSKNNKVG